MNLAVIGLGKLGLPLACLQAKKHRVFGVDFNASTVETVNRGVSPLSREPGVDPLLKEVIRSGKLTAHTDYSVVADCDISLIIVPTPSQKDGSFTSKYVVEAVRQIGEAVKGRPQRHVVVVCSTVMPNECETTIRDALEESAEEPMGTRLGLVYSPEFIALGTVIEDMLDPDMTIIGMSHAWAGAMYYDLLPPLARVNDIHYMTLTSAELAKISLNAYVTNKISFANTVSEMAEGYTDADAHQILRAIGSDSRVGHPYISPGGPYGGPCFPRDNRAFAKAGRDVGVDMQISMAVDKINDRQINRMVNKILTYQRSEVGVLGLTYKPGAPIIEEAFGVRLVNALAEQTDKVIRVWDALVPTRGHLFDEKVKWLGEPLGCFGNDCVTVLTIPDPNIVKYIPNVFESAAKSGSIVLDPWNCVPQSPWSDTHIVTLGRGA